MKNYLDLSGKVALVTGAGSGIGHATAIALAEAGAAVAINYHRNEAGAEDAKRKVVAAGGRAITVRADVTRSADVRQMVAAHHEREADVTVAAVGVPLEHASSFGVLSTSADGRVHEFREKPKRPTPVPGDPSRVYDSMGNSLF